MRNKKDKIMSDYEIRISESGMSVFVHKSESKKVVRLFSVCDYNSLEEARSAASEFIKNELNK